MVAITCNGANRYAPKEYVIKAVGYGGVEDTLQERHLYSLKGRLIAKNDVKNPRTDVHEFFYEAPNRLLVGTTETFASDLHDTVGVTGFGIILSKSTIIEDSVQSKAVKEGKAEKKKTTVLIVRHGDYHPTVSFLIMWFTHLSDSDIQCIQLRRIVEFTVKYLCRPYPHLAGTVQFLHPGREVNINGFIIDYDIEAAQYVVDVSFSNTHQSFSIFSLSYHP